MSGILTKLKGKTPVATVEAVETEVGPGFVGTYNINGESKSCYFIKDEASQEVHRIGDPEVCAILSHDLESTRSMNLNNGLRNGRGD